MPQLEWKDGGIEQLFTNDPNGVKPQWRYTGVPDADGSKSTDLDTIADQAITSLFFFVFCFSGFEFFFYVCCLICFCFVVCYVIVNSKNDCKKI